MAEWRIDRARQKYGAECLIIAGIQSGNTGSFKVTNSWATASAGTLEAILLKTRSKAPKLDERFQIREIENRELEDFAHRLNYFYREHNFYRLQSAETLNVWQQTSPFSSPYRSFMVAENQAGELVSGVAISKEYHVRQMKVLNMPLVASLLNKLVHVVPSSRVIRPLTTQYFWFNPNAIDAAKALWETVRWRWHHEADVVSHTYDASTQVKEIIDAPRWLPRGEINIVTNQPLQSRLPNFTLA